MSRDEQLADAATYAIYTGLGRNIPVRDRVMARLTPAQREDIDAACGRHREHMAAQRDH